MKQDEYRKLDEASAFCRVQRTFIELSGADRASFLHNLCTNDVRSLTPGQGCEAYLTDVKGRILSHVFLLAGETSIVLETVPDQADRLMPHLDKYLIREDVTLTDHSAQWRLVLLAGPRAVDVLQQLGVTPPTNVLSHEEVQLEGATVTVCRMPLVSGDCFGLRCAHDVCSDFEAALSARQVSKVDPDVLEVARIESGFPQLGVDIQDQFPQEIGRVEQAVSFTKGCYLGQETVARIDALGHVNQHLVGLRFDGPTVPAVGLQLLHEEKVVGNVTSACFSPKCNAALALGFVRREVVEAKSALASDGGIATIVDLPV